jgi:hypothetical protein
MVSRAEKFNNTGFSKWLNSPAGRLFRFGAGVLFLAIGIMYDHRWFGIVALIWFIFPLSAGGLDVCYISGALGGPFKGSKVRKYQEDQKV